MFARHVKKFEDRLYCFTKNTVYFFILPAKIYIHKKSRLTKSVAMREVKFCVSFNLHRRSFIHIMIVVIARLPFVDIR